MRVYESCDITEVCFGYVWAIEKKKNKASELMC